MNTIPTEHPGYKVTIWASQIFATHDRSLETSYEPLGDWRNHSVTEAGVQIYEQIGSSRLDKEGWTTVTYKGKTMHRHLPTQDRTYFRQHRGLQGNVYFMNHRTEPPSLSGLEKMVSSLIQIMISDI